MSSQSIAPLRAGNGGVITEQMDNLPESGSPSPRMVTVDTTGKLNHSPMPATDAITLTQLLSAPASHPLTPGVLWLDEGRVSVSLPWAASGGAWDDSGKWYDSQSWSE